MSRHAGPRRPVPRRRVWGIALGTAVLLVLGLGGRGTYALFTDTATVTAGSAPSTAFTSGSVPKPLLTCKENSGANVTISFPASTQYTYTAVLDNGGRAITVSADGTPRTITISQAQAPSGLLSTTTYTVTVTATLTGTAWFARATTQIKSSPGLIGIGANISCP